MEQKQKIEEVNTYENEVEQTEYKNCLGCEFAILHDCNNVFCYRRENEGVIYEIDKDKLALPCLARDAEVWDEEIDENGDMKVDRELSYGYQAYMRKLSDSRMGD